MKNHLLQHRTFLRKKMVMSQICVNSYPKNSIFYAFKGKHIPNFSFQLQIFESVFNMYVNYWLNYLVYSVYVPTIKLQYD